MACRSCEPASESSRLDSVSWTVGEVLGTSEMEMDHQTSEELCA